MNNLIFIHSKLSLLFLSVLICISCVQKTQETQDTSSVQNVQKAQATQEVFDCDLNNQDYNLYSIDVRKRYFDILFKKWQDSAEKQEHYDIDPPSGNSDLGSIIFQAARESMLMQYGFGTNSSNPSGVVVIFTFDDDMQRVGTGSEGMGLRSGRYNILLTRSPDNKEQIWILASRTSGNILSMHKEQANFLSNEECQHQFRISVLRARNDSIRAAYCGRIFPRWGENLDSDSIDFQHIDNVSEFLNHSNGINASTAVTVATAVVRRYYGNVRDIDSVRTRLMGDNEEYWQVSFVDDPSLTLRNCRRTFEVLVSRENGRVLSITQRLPDLTPRIARWRQRP